jgi:putative transposase
MARLARVVVPGLPHHITQRGNNKRDIFLCDEDRRLYLSLISKYSQEYGVSILSFCLMTNHIHFIAIPLCNDSLARTFNFSHMHYARAFNERQGLTGHLWHSRYYSCVLDGSHLLNAARYVERNPVRAGMVINPWEWNWSSAAFHSGKQLGDFKFDGLFSHIGKTPQLWSAFISDPESHEFQILIKEHTRKGRPAGPDAFVTAIEARIGRRIRELQSGRPRKKSALSLV